MTTLPTAEEVILESLYLTISKSRAKELMIEFAKLHVTEALKAAAEKAEAIEGWSTGFSGSAASVDKESILNSYPLTNIK